MQSTVYHAAKPYLISRQRYIIAFLPAGQVFRPISCTINAHFCKNTSKYPTFQQESRLKSVKKVLTFLFLYGIIIKICDFIMVTKMGLKAYFDVAKYKIGALFSRRRAFSAIVFDSKIGKRSAIKNHSRLYGSTLGEYSYLGRNCLVQKTRIGKFVSIADGCNIGLPSHSLKAVSTSPVFFFGKNIIGISYSDQKPEEQLPTVIGNDVWIGAGVLIKSGIQIGDGAVIGAGAVVTHDVPPYEIWAGTPAKCIRKRFDEETIQKLLELKWWEWDETKLKQYAPDFESPQKLLEQIEATHSSKR